MKYNTKITLIITLITFLVLGAYFDGTPLIDIPKLFK